MKNTLMFLLVSLLLAVSLTACGGGGQTTGTADNYGNTAGNGADSSVNGANGALNGTNGSGTEGYRGDSNSGNNGGLMDDARDAVDDAGRSVRNAVDDAGNAIDRAF